MTSVLAYIPTSYISNVALPEHIPVTDIRSGNRIPVVVNSIDEFGNTEDYTCYVTVAQPIISSDKKFVHLFCNIKTDEPISIPIDCYISRHK